MRELIIEVIGWLSTAVFLFSIIVPQRIYLHSLGVFSSVTTGIYAYAHGATAIWVKWIIALLFHAYMWYKISKESSTEDGNALLKKPSRA
jgi:hypothetical protein